MDTRARCFRLLTAMIPSNRCALKEWAVVCEALAAGRQDVLLRKGGILEGPDGFRVEHNEFWLLPTRFHQNPDEIVPDARPLLERLRRAAPPPGRFRIELYAVVEDVIRLDDETKLGEFAGRHILAEETVRQRFHYREPGLFVVPVRVFRLPEPFELADSPEIAGCRSWVELPEKLPTERLRALSGG